MGIAVSVNTVKDQSLCITCLWMHHLIYTMYLSVLQGDSWNVKGSSPSSSFRSRHDSAPNQNQQGSAASVTKTGPASVPDSDKGKIYCHKWKECLKTKHVSKGKSNKIGFCVLHRVHFKWIWLRWVFRIHMCTLLQWFCRMLGFGLWCEAKACGIDVTLSPWRGRKGVHLY